MSTPPVRASLALAVAALAALLVALACSHPGTEASRPAQAPSPVASHDPAAAFQVVKAVLQSPRCVNCHPAGDAPLQGDDGHVHRQHVLRGPGGFGVTGLECDACHGDANPPASYGPHAPPGISTGWRLPPPDTKMVFEGLDASALCEQLKDPARNGGKDLDALVHHVSTDPLVLWGWAPGHGRTPVPVAHADFVAAFKSWASAGAPCPRR
jgi:hypothetical protein